MGDKKHAATRDVPELQGEYDDSFKSMKLRQAPVTKSVKCDRTFSIERIKLDERD